MGNAKYRRRRKHSLVRFLSCAAGIFVIVYCCTHYDIADRLGIDKDDYNRVKSFIKNELSQKDIYNDESNQGKIAENILTNRQELSASIYEQIKNGGTGFEVSFSDGDISADDVGNEFKKLLNIHPEIFWLTGAASGSGLKVNDVNTYTYELETNCDKTGIVNMMGELDITVNNIVTQAGVYSSEYEKAMYVHDEIVKKCEYDEETYYGGTADGLVYTSYGCLVGNRAVCSGYAKAYQLILNRLGIECGYITGEATSDGVTGGHAWNYVKIDGKYSFVDVTWDDPIIIGRNKDDNISHKYFCISYEEICKDHTFDNSFDTEQFIQ